MKTLPLLVEIPRSKIKTCGFSTSFLGTTRNLICSQKNVMTFYFYPYPPFQARHENFYENFLPHLVFTKWKLTPFEMQLESVLNSLYIRSNRPQVFFGKCVLKICMQQFLYTGEHPYAKVQFIKLTVWHGCSPVNLLHIFRTYFPKNTYRWLLLLYSVTAI